MWGHCYFFFLHSAKPSLLFKQLLSFLYRHNSNNHFYFSFVIPQCVQCCLSPRIAEMAFLPFLSPLCLGQLFFLKISFLFVGELVFVFVFLPSVSAFCPQWGCRPASPHSTPRSSLRLCHVRLGPPNHSGSHFGQTNLHGLGYYPFNSMELDPISHKSFGWQICLRPALCRQSAADVS